ncbi:MAG: cell division protein FtsK [Armatimonadetes bacterium CG07_land_8_20_14_0_80_40_9]|nr:MAG: cell division protein FtsK [Armatimonadetes bacterium CG07_land_8_20_14_0_80_40_9]
MAKNKKKESFDLEYEIVGIALLSLSILSYLSLLLTPQSGALGRLFSSFLREGFGWVSYFIPLTFAILGLYLVWQKSLRLYQFSRKSFGLVLLFLSLFPLLHLIASQGLSGEELIKIAKEGRGGGIIGALTSLYLLKNFGRIGSYVLVISLILIATSLTFSTSLSSLLRFLQLTFKKVLPHLKSFKDVLGKGIKKLSSLRLPKKNLLSNPVEEVLPPPSEELEEDGASKEEERVPLPEKRRGVLPEEQVKSPTYQLPPLSLLKAKNFPSSVQEGLIKEQKDKILETLGDFGIEAEIEEISSGPRITRYELKPSAGVKVREVVNLADDLALHLAAAPIRVEAPIPGKSAVGIEVPNKSKSIVYLKELIEEVPLLEKVKSKLFFGLGKSIAGENKIADLTRMPHLLIAGATGSGKSVCINSIIASFLFKAKPDEIKFLIIDPKRVELTLYNDIPHLVCPVVIDAKMSALSLELMVKKMDERYEMFAQSGVRNIEGYNNKEEKKLPYILIIIDELADLMFQTALEVEKNICRLAQLSRATGIHLIIATQRPSVNVITGLIKANIPSRISFAVASQTDSRTILDMNGAERLLGEGDMLFLPIEDSKPTRLQGAFINEKETKSLVDFWKRQAEPEYEEDFLNLAPPEKGGDEEIEIDDELFREAVDIIMSEGQASVSMLQRKLKIGYARAGRLIDLMEKQGIIGPSLGSKPREVLRSDGFS